MKSVQGSAPMFVATIVVLACGDASRGPGGGTWVAERDTIGDTVVVRTISGSVGLGEYRLERELTIGVLEGPDEYILGTVDMLAVGPQGDIYAYDAQVPVIRKYDREGRFVATIGREGGGPGEYQRARGMVALPDGTVRIWDASGPRLISFSSEGDYLGDLRVGSYRSFAGRSLFSDTLGNLYAGIRFVETGKGRQRSGGAGLLKLSSSGEVVDRLYEPDFGYEPPRIEESLTTGTTTTVLLLRIPFTPEPTWTFSPHGYLVAGVGDRYAVSLFRTDAPVLRLEREVDAVAVDPDEKAAWHESIADGGGRWDGPDIPNTKPAYRQLAVGMDGRIWVRLYQRAERREPVDSERPNPRRDWPEPTVYDVLEPDGRYLGAVHVPRETTISVMRGDYVWGVTRDSLDVQYIERFRLTGSREP